MRVGLSAALVAVAIAGVSAEAPALRASPQVVPVFSARLEPGIVVPAPRGVRTDAHGSLTGRLNVDYCILGCVASYRLVFRNLTGEPTDIVIRFGRQGSTGHIWHRLCTRYGGRGSCPRARSGSLRGTFSVWRPRNFPREIYIEISTARNRLGELRGQIRS
jgi:hypothetical protein